MIGKDSKAFRSGTAINVLVQSPAAGVEVLVVLLRFLDPNSQASNASRESSWLHYLYQLPADPRFLKAFQGLRYSIDLSKYSLAHAFLHSVFTPVMTWITQGLLQHFAA